MAGIGSSIYNTIFRRNQVFLLAVFASAFTFETVFDRTFDKVWDNVNKGRQWKDIRAKYIEEDE